MPIKYTYDQNGNLISAISVDKDGNQKIPDGIPMPLPDYMYPQGENMLSIYGQQKPNVPNVNIEDKILGKGKTLSAKQINKITNKYKDKLQGKMFGSGVMTAFDRAQAQFERAQEENILSDPITGQKGNRNFEDFVQHIALNKKRFNESDGNLDRFNQYIDQIQSGVIDRLSEKEAAFLNDLKNNKIDF